MRRGVLSSNFTAVRSKQEQLGKLACCQPRHPAAVINPPECQASVTIEAVPAQVGLLESFANHGLHGIPEDRLHTSDFYKHARSELPQHIALFTFDPYLRPLRLWGTTPCSLTVPKPRRARASRPLAVPSDSDVTRRRLQSVEHFDFFNS